MGAAGEDDRARVKAPPFHLDGSKVEGAMAKSARLVWASCLAIGTCTHIFALIKNGGNYNSIPLASAIFWNSLTILDPLAAALLYLRPRVGVTATMAIMISDVAHNTWVVATFGGIVWMVVAQAAFLLLVLASAHLIWRAAPDLRISIFN